MDAITLPNVELIPQEDLREATMKLANEDRLHFQAQQQILRRRATLIEHNKCLRCWYGPSRCICSRVKPLDIPHDVVLLLHHKEYGRLSNTGKIIAASCPNTSIYFSGIREQEEMLRQHIAASKNPCIVLFPSVDSITVPELLERFPAPGSDSSVPPEKRVRLDAASEEGAASSGPRPFTIIVVDGTWNQAKHVVRIVPPEVVRVRVDPTSPSLFVLRTQTQPNRICTLEAFALLLREMGSAVSLSRFLLASLKVHVDAALEDRGCNTLYEGKDKGDLEEEEESPAPRPDKIDRHAFKAAKRKRREVLLANAAAAAATASVTGNTEAKSQ